MPVHERLDQMMAEVAPAQYSEAAALPVLKAANTAATFLPDVIPSVAQLREKIEPFVRKALPYKGIDTSEQLRFDVDLMQRNMDESLLEWRKKFWELFSTHPVLKQKCYLGMPLHEQRELVLRQFKVYVDSGLFEFHDYLRNGLRFVESLAMLSYHGCNLATKISVNFGLFGGSVVTLGSEKHREIFEDRIRCMKVRGGFALTELGHGSNARGIETTATYDPTTDEFVIHSPNQTAQKFWIGNLACHANHAVVFAQLYVDGVHHGVHAFVVRIRTDDGDVVEGVRIHDCGFKSGLNGIDNGSAMFSQMRVGRDTLLDRFGTVTPEGKYVSDISSNTKRFTTMIGALVGGRVVVAQGAINMAKVGLSIAIRYALSRRQFGPTADNEDEIPLLDFLSHQRRLFPLLAKTYALQVTMNKVKELYSSKSGDSKSIHIIVAAIKPVATWHRAETLQECREACGGMGFHASNRIGVLKADSDIDVTWEGDNNVLLQQVASSLIPKGGASAILDVLKKSMMMEIRENPLKRSLTSSRHLRNFEFYIHALEYREARLLRALVNKMYRNRNLGKFECWNKCLDLVKELALAHADRIVIENFVEHVQRSPEPLRPMLSALCSLYSLHIIQSNMSWFLTFRYISPLKAKAIWEEINSLCAAIHPHARSLIDSFGIPDQVIDAPIAGDWVGAFSFL